LVIEQSVPTDSTDSTESTHLVSNYRSSNSLLLEFDTQSVFKPEYNLPYVKSARILSSLLHKIRINKSVDDCLVILLTALLQSNGLSTCNLTNSCIEPIMEKKNCLNVILNGETSSGIEIFEATTPTLGNDWYTALLKLDYGSKMFIKFKNAYNQNASSSIGADAAAARFVLGLNVTSQVTNGYNSASTAGHRMVNSLSGNKATYKPNDFSSMDITKEIVISWVNSGHTQAQCLIEYTNMQSRQTSVTINKVTPYDKLYLIVKNLTFISWVQVPKPVITNNDTVISTVSSTLTLTPQTPQISSTWLNMANIPVKPKLNPESKAMDLSNILESLKTMDKDSKEQVIRTIFQTL
jgi:hypothetical protein